MFIASTPEVDITNILRGQIPNTQKVTYDLTVILVLLGSAPVNAMYKLLVKSTPGVNFTNVLRTAFAHVDPKSVKNTVKLSVSFYSFGIYERKSCM